MVRMGFTCICKQTPFQLAAIGTLCNVFRGEKSPIYAFHHFIYTVIDGGLKTSFNDKSSY